MCMTKCADGLSLRSPTSDETFNPVIDFGAEASSLNTGTEELLLMAEYVLQFPESAPEECYSREVTFTIDNVVAVD